MLRTKILFWVQALLFMSGYTHQTMGPLKNGSRRSFKKKKQKRKKTKTKTKTAKCLLPVLLFYPATRCDTQAPFVHGRPVRPRSSGQVAALAPGTEGLARPRAQGAKKTRGSEGPRRRLEKRKGLQNPLGHLCSFFGTCFYRILQQFVQDPKGREKGSERERDESFSP